jgi:hypothetical protein
VHNVVDDIRDNDSNVKNSNGNDNNADDNDNNDDSNNNNNNSGSNDNSNDNNEINDNNTCTYNTNKKMDCSNLVISHNRNWFNGFSIHEVWLFLRRELDDIRAELWHMRPDINPNPNPNICLSNNSDNKSDPKPDLSPNPDISPNPNLNSNSKLEPKPTPKNVNKINDKIIPLSPLNPNSYRNSNSNSNRFNFNNNDIPKMGVTEWYHHCNVLLKVNSALSCTELVEILASRVFMMGMCRDLMDYRENPNTNPNSNSNFNAYCKTNSNSNNNPNPNQKIDNSNENGGVTKVDDSKSDNPNPNPNDIDYDDHNITDNVKSKNKRETNEENEFNILSLSTLKFIELNTPNPNSNPNTNLSWAVSLCPRYKSNITLEDYKLFKLLSSTMIVNPNSNPDSNLDSNLCKELLSIYHKGSQKDTISINPYGINNIKKTGGDGVKQVENEINGGVIKNSSDDISESRERDGLKEAEPQKEVSLISVLKYTCTEILLVLNEIIDSDEFLSHFCSSIALEKESERDKDKGDGVGDRKDRKVTSAIDDNLGISRGDNNGNDEKQLQTLSHMTIKIRFEINNLIKYTKFLSDYRT